MHPTDVHYVRADTIRAHRAEVSMRPNAAHPERFVRHPSTSPALPKTAWINKPEHAPGILA
jgi:putative transposase